VNGAVGYLAGIQMIESPDVPPGHFYLLPTGAGPVMFVRPAARRPWWRRTIARIGRWLWDALNAAGSVWVAPGAGNDRLVLPRRGRVLVLRA
jgi:hypothetical protein